jgi:hypothetical protein
MVLAQQEVAKGMMHWLQDAVVDFDKGTSQFNGFCLEIRYEYV